MTVLVLSPDHVGMIADESATAYPKECCGLLIGYGDQTVSVTDVVPAANQESSNDRFLIDPQVQFDWIRKLRGSERRLIGHYHSHPNGQAEPSRHDREMALETGQIWVIAPVEQGRSGDLKAFEVNSETGTFVPVPIIGA